MRSTCSLFLYLGALLLSGCASSGHSTLLGSGIGAFVGGSIGALANAGPKGRGRAQNIFLGSTIGSLVGGGGCFLLHEPLARKTLEPPPLERAKQSPMPLESEISAGSKPVLVPPKVETRYVDDQIRGNTFIPGHLEYQITEPSRWNR